jgi:excisionase family DNA binding protein
VTGTAEITELDRLLDAKEIAERLSLSVRTVQRLTRENKIPHVSIGSVSRYRWEAVVEWVLLLERGGETVKLRKHRPELRSAR